MREPKWTDEAIRAVFGETPRRIWLEIEGGIRREARPGPTMATWSLYSIRPGRRVSAGDGKWIDATERLEAVVHSEQRARDWVARVEEDRS